jgi:hypothetical protein
MEIGGLHPGEPMQPADVLEQSVGDVEDVTPSRSTAEDDGDQLVVAQACNAVSFEFLSRSIVWGNGFHLYSESMSSAAEPRTRAWSGDSVSRVPMLALPRLQRGAPS